MASPSDLPRRGAGVLLHVSSLPGAYGIGDLGPIANQWIDRLAAAGQTWWQTLPLAPVGDGDSPYQAFSAFAGEPMLISPDLLHRDGLLAPGDLKGARLPAGDVNYARVRERKTALLAKACETFNARRPKALAQAFERFVEAERHWLDDYALFMALKGANVKRGKAIPWNQWPRELVTRDKTALADAARTLADEIDRKRLMQFLFFRQLGALREYARQKRIRIIGDLPIFVSGESVDVWTNPRLFELDRDLQPKFVAGVPPDMFSATGQRWGNPLYNWQAMKKDKYAWWIARFRAALAQADIVRIDHFRGFAGYWEIPASSPTAVDGRWAKGPGAGLFKVVQKELQALPFVAEDLGVITPDVEKLRDGFSLPGMRVLQFAFGGDSKNPHLPENHGANVFAYTATHDNQTTVGWFKKLSSAGCKQLADYVPDAAKDPCRALLRLTWLSHARQAIVPAQDLLKLDDRARMNTPGKSQGNWRWRMTDLRALDKPMAELAELTETCLRQAR